MSALRSTIAVAIAACTSGGPGTPPGSTTTTAQLQACDPLAEGAPPIELGALVGAGRAKDGTVYVIDRGAPELRAFVSDRSVLRRRKVSGSGEGEGFVTVLLGDDPRIAVQIRVELAGVKATRMGISTAPPDPKTKSFDITTQGEELALLEPSDLAAFILVNISSVRLMYAATTPDGQRFVAFEPDAASSESKVRVFYGPTERVAQRTVLDVNYDSSVHLRFDLDGTPTDAQLMWRNSASLWGPPRLTRGGVSTPLTPLPGSPGADWEAGPVVLDAGADGGTADLTPPPAEPAALLAGLRFYCF
jgi:hypothetical protein